jgi:hypothetical protein
VVVGTLFGRIAARMAKPKGLSYFGEVLYELMRRPPRYVDNPSQLARVMREHGYEKMRQQYVDRYMKLGGYRVPAHFCSQVADTLDLDPVERMELAWAMVYGQDLTLENIERTRSYKNYRRLIQGAKGSVGAGDRRL